MTSTLENLEEIRDEVSHESFKKRFLKREIKELLINVDDDSLDQINNIRVVINQSINQFEFVCEKIQGLSWSLIDPDETKLEIVNEIIILGKSVVDLSYEVVESLKPLLHNDVMQTEINDFVEIISHCKEVLEDIESVFFDLPNHQDFIQSKSELESLQ